MISDLSIISEWYNGGVEGDECETVMSPRVSYLTGGGNVVHVTGTKRVVSYSITSGDHELVMKHLFTEFKGIVPTELSSKSNQLVRFPTTMSSSNNVMFVLFGPKFWSLWTLF